MKCGAGRRDWECTRKCDQWCLMSFERKKVKYPKKFGKVPGLKCEGATCSYGLDIRHADPLKNFQKFYLYRTFCIS